VKRIANEHLALLLELHARYPKTALAMHFLLNGVQNLLLAVGGIEPYMQTLEGCMISRNSPCNQVRRIRELMNLNIYKKHNNSLGKLYSEMYRKFAA
jgi:hypothetical protein